MNLPSLPQIPKHKNADFVLFIGNQEEDPKWFVELKSPSIEPEKNSIGKFRRDLKKLKALRSALIRVDTTVQQEEDDDDEKHEIQTRSILVMDSSCIKDPIRKSIGFESLQPDSPSNPLLDQSVRIIKPARWIDCISRESKRVFVQDNWIVARIRLPSLSKDLVGLKRI